MPAAGPSRWRPGGGAGVRPWPRSLFLVLVVDDFRIHDGVITRLRAGRLCVLALRILGLSLLSGSVDRLAHGGRLLVEVVHGGLNLVVVVGALQGLLQCGDGLSHRSLGVLGDLVGVLVEQLLGTERQGIGLVTHLNGLATLLVSLGVGLSLLDHAVDLVLAQGGSAGDSHGLLLPGGHVLGVDVDDAVGVDVERHLDLRDAARGRHKTGQLKVAQRLVIADELALTLEYLDHHRRLIVLSSSEHLRTLGRDGGVALDDLGHHAALGLNAEAQRGDVEEQYIFDLTLQHTGLQGGAEGHNLIGVDALVRILTSEFLDELGDSGHTGRTTNEDDLVDLRDVESSILHDGVERGAAALEEVGGHALELSAGQLLVKVERPGSTSGDVRQIDMSFRSLRQLNLGALGGLLQTLLGHLVGSQVDAVSVLELGDEPVDDALVPVVTAEVVIAVGGLHLENAVGDVEQGDVEGATAEVKDQDGLVLVGLVEAICQGGCGGLVDDTVDGQTGDLTGLLGGLTLGVREVSRDGDDGVRHRLTEVSLGIPLEFLQNERTDLLRLVGLVVNTHGPRFTHMALDGADGAINVGDGLALGDFADEGLAGVSECDHRRGGTSTLSVRDDSGLAALKDGDARVGGSEVDTD
ncbi:NAD-specific glutamate dehydrogenase [Cutibacterium acnes HL202PA1]|nr:NAD-specific glutamate dehydrogenase [Cutibacterium acnes HL202PA1]